MPDLLGSNEMSVLELTNRLRDLGYYDGPFEERPWPATTAALERFQLDRGLAATRCADALTADALRNSICY
jgi:peptidoglycan hydrolase-like protein with peptidoglycan-binding domain